jgi:O-antigen/teichoic acid export membrane protein
MMGLLALPIILLAFGPVWLPAVPVAEIMCGAAGFVVLTSVTVALMTASGAIRRFFALQAISVPLLIAALWIGKHWDIAGAAWGVAVWSAVLSLVSLHQAQKILRLSMLALARPFGGSLIALAATLLPALAVRTWQPITVDHWFLPSIFAGLAGLGGWIAYMLVSRHPLLGELRLAGAAILRKLAP